MSGVSAFLVFLVVALMVPGNVAVASGSERPNGREAVSVAGPADRPALERDRASLPNAELQELTDTYDRRGPLEYSGIVTGDRVLVLIEHQLSAAAVDAALDKIGAARRTHIGSSFVEAYVPINRLEALQNQPGIRNTKPAPEASPPLAQASEPLPLSVTGNEVSKTGAAAWHAVGLDGSGVKIGIIDHFDQTVWNGATTNGDLPAPAGTVCVVNGSQCNLWTVTPGETHGAAVAEIVHEMAPGAALYLGHGNTLGDLIAVIDYFHAQGVQIINHSATYPFDGPGDGTGPAAAVVDYAASRGIAWVNSAGNFAGGSYWRGTWTDLDADGWLEFPGGFEEMFIDCGWALGLRWDDWFIGNPTDYDVYIWDTPTDAFVTTKASSIDDQTAGASPLENFGGPLQNAGCAVGEQDLISVFRFAEGDGASGDTLEIGLAGGLEFPSDPYSAAIPMGDTYNPGAMSVGAVYPPAGTAIAPYSSRGPTNDARTKPDLSAPAGMATFSAGAFSGTSAAAPVVAGASALLFDAGLVANPTQLKTYLLGSAVVDRGSAGPDNSYGAGELYFGDPPNQGPVGVDDGYGATEDIQLVVLAAAGMLKNDTDPEDDPLTVSAADVTSAKGGAVAVAADGSFTYDPPGDFAGIDTFDYTVSDGPLTDTAAVTITVAGVPDPPAAVDDAYVAAKNTQLSKNAAAGVLFNDTDPEDDPLNVSAFHATSIEGGTVAVAVDGSFTYDPPPDYTGSDTFDYTVSDGALTDTATVTITVSAPPPPGGGGGGFLPAPVADPCPGTIPEVGFTDLAGVQPEAVAAVNCIAFYGITTGKTPTTYDPNGKVLRWQMALFLTRAATDLRIPVPVIPSDGGFTDLAGLQVITVTAINQLKALGITTGKTTTTFDPAGEVTRWQMALFVQRLLVKAGVALDDPPADAGFVDLGATQPDAIVAINQLAGLGVVQGTTATTYYPTGNVLRWQMALFLTRSLRAGGVTPE